MNRNFNEFIDSESLELEVPTFCFVMGCVSARRDKRYIASFSVTGWNPVEQGLVLVTGV